MTTLWSILIHDNVPAMPCKLFLYATHHTIHHEKGKGSFKNYGKFTSIWDRIMGTYDDPDRVFFGWRSEKLVNFFDSFNKSIQVFNNLLANSQILEFFILFLDIEYKYRILIVFYKLTKNLMTK